MNLDRIYYIDNLKGLLIILVVIGHCIQISCPDYDNDFLFKYIYSFHMPLFMFISGYVNYRENIKLDIIKKRFFQLVLPFFMWTLLNSIINLNLLKVFQVLLHPDLGLWFLWVLFIIILIHSICVYIADNVLFIKQELLVISITILMIIILLFVNFRLFGFQFIAWYFVFYSLGYYMNKAKLINRIKPNYLYIFAILFLVSGYFWMRKQPPTFMLSDASLIYNYIYKFIVAIFAIFFFCLLFYRYCNNKMYIFGKFGAITLGIYAIHMNLVSLIYEFVNKLNITYYPLYLILFFILLLFISYCIFYFMSKNKYISFLFLGSKLK